MDIIFENVTYVYQPGTPFAHKALVDLSFRVSSGSFVAIIGHTGSGKSTLIQHLNGLITPTAGEVTVGRFHITPDKKPKDMKELRAVLALSFNIQSTSCLQKQSLKTSLSVQKISVLVRWKSIIGCNAFFRSLVCLRNYSSVRRLN